jgi:hypothetical protein
MKFGRYKLQSISMGQRFEFMYDQLFNKINVDK